MDSLFNMDVEKYWDFPKPKNEEEKNRRAIEIQQYINSNNYMGSEKIDGHYSRTVIDYDGEIRLESRTKSTVTGEYGNKADHVPHITNALKKHLPNGTIIIGELFFPGKTSQEVGKILLCKPDKAVARQEKEFSKLQYYIHDIWYYGGKNLMKVPYEERIKFLESLAFEDENIIFAKHYGNPDDIRNLLSDVFSHDGEGIVLMRKDAIVEPGKRPARKSIKVKRELDNDIDCFLTGGYKEATRLYTGKEIESWPYWENLKTGAKCFGDYYEDYAAGVPYEPITKPYYNDWPGSLELGILKEGKVCVLGYVSGISDDIKADFAENPDKYRMKPCKVTAMQFTDDMNLRHPKFNGFREDLNIEDCTWEKYFTK